MDKKKNYEREIPEKKIKAVAELVSLIKKSKSIVLVSIKNLPASQFQIIAKKLRGNVEIRVPKKNLINKAIDDVGGKVIDFKEFIKEDIALLFSDLDSFEISAMLSKNKSKAKAKVGQEVEEEVIIEPGPTELVPGPIISELTGLGIKFIIEDGKISIKEKKIILKKGDKVSSQAASIMSKLDIKPVSVGLEPIAAYDSGEKKIFKNIKVEPEKILENIKNSVGRALAFAVKIIYPCKETIGYLLGKASTEEKALSDLIKSQEVK